MLSPSRGKCGSAKHGGGAQRDGSSAVVVAWRLRRWRQRDSATSAEAWRRHGGGGSVSGGGGSAKRGGGEKCDGGSAIAAARMLQRWRQRDSATLAAAWRWGGSAGSISGRSRWEEAEK